MAEASPLLAVVSSAADRLYRLALRILDHGPDAESAFFVGVARSRDALPVSTWARPDDAARKLAEAVARAALESLEARVKSSQAPPLHEGAGRKGLPPPSAQAVGALPPGARVALVLESLEGWTRADVADALAWTEKDTEAHFAQGRAALEACAAEAGLPPDGQLNAWAEGTEAVAAPAGLAARAAAPPTPAGEEGRPKDLFSNVPEDELSSALELGLTGATAHRAPEPAAPPPVPEQVWYLGVEDKRLGPLTVGRVQELWAGGDINLDTLCWKQGFTDWVPLAQVKEMASLLLSKQEAVAAAAAMPKAQSPQDVRPVAAAAPAVSVSSLLKDEMASMRRPTSPAPAPGVSEAPKELLPQLPEPPGQRSELLPPPPSLVSTASEMARVPEVTYRPPAPQGLPTAIKVLLGLAGVVIVALAAAVLLLVLRSSGGPQSGLAAAGDAGEQAAAPDASAVAAAPTDAGSRAEPLAGDAGALVLVDGGAEPGLESLSQQDIMKVVLAHKEELGDCVAEQQERSPNTHGLVKVRWTVATSGEVTLVEMAEDAYRGTPLAQCLIEEISGWRFPPHRTAGEPVTFPIKF